MNKLAGVTAPGDKRRLQLVSRRHLSHDKWRSLLIAAGLLRQTTGSDVIDGCCFGLLEFASHFQMDTNRKVILPPTNTEVIAKEERTYTNMKQVVQKC